jgi:hypothetical protein
MNHNNNERENMLIINHNDREFHSSIGIHILLHSVLRQHVAPQSTGMIKGLATHDASEGLFLCVNSHVAFHMSRFAEPFSWYCAIIKLLSSVLSHVDFEISSSTETLLTDVTSEQVFPCVHELMSLQISSLTETLLALGTHGHALKMVGPDYNSVISGNPTHLLRN